MLRTCRKCGSDMVSYGNQGRFRCPHCAKNYLRKWYAKNVAKNYKPINCKCCGKQFNPRFFYSEFCKPYCKFKYLYKTDASFKKKIDESRKKYVMENRDKVRHRKKLWDIKRDPDLRKAYNRRSRLELLDTYVIKKLKDQGIINPSKEIIEQRRLSIKLKRKINEIQRKINTSGSNDNAVR